MRLWFKTHRVLGWLLPLIGAAILAGMVGNERLPSLHITGMYLEGFPVQILSPALAATAVIGSLSTPAPRARITAARSIPAIETLYTLAMIALAGLITETLTLWSSSGEFGVFTRNLTAMVGAGLIVRTFLGGGFGTLTPLIWGVVLLATGNPEGDRGFSWVALPALTRATLVGATGLLLLGLALNAIRAMRHPPS